MPERAPAGAGGRTGARAQGGPVTRGRARDGAPGVLPCAVPANRAYVAFLAISPEPVLTRRDRLITLFVSDSPRGDGEGSATGVLGECGS
ncbi:hypothetical protein GCM10010247_21700 [Streptomyces calvus]|nr:hypothetical protein GCM10010247_21700 [Streptomyces calvus]